MTCNLVTLHTPLETDRENPASVSLHSPGHAGPNQGKEMKEKMLTQLRAILEHAIVNGVSTDYTIRIDGHDVADILRRVSI